METLIEKQKIIHQKIALLRDTHYEIYRLWLEIENDLTYEFDEYLEKIDQIKIANKSKTQ